MPIDERPPPQHGTAHPEPVNGEPRAAPQPPLHLRVFRSVPLHDAEMLVPGAVARFTLLDKLFIWVPVLVGIASAIYKISTSVLLLSLPLAVTIGNCIVLSLGGYTAWPGCRSTESEILMHRIDPADQHGIPHDIVGASVKR